jgi:hypothetical protein
MLVILHQKNKNLVKMSLNTSIQNCFQREREATSMKANIGVLSVNVKTLGLTTLSDTSKNPTKNFSMPGLTIQ